MHSQQCEECDVSIKEEAFHLIFGGRMYRFCCHLHRQKFRKVLLQSLVQSQLRQRLEAENWDGA